MSEATTRAQFVDHQLSFNGGWYRNLQASGQNVEAAVQARREAYLARWGEAARYIGRGGRVLDIGGGNLYPDLVRYFRAQDWDYWYIDVDPPHVQGSARVAAEFGYESSHFACGMNHELDYADGFFDAVFSSHCIEHSMDLRLTLVQLNRILREGGVATVSIPLGWDRLPAHPYFLMETEWLALFEDAGFRIRAYQISGEYAERTQDLMIAAEKRGPPRDRLRLDPFDYAKARFGFRAFDAPEIVYQGGVAIMPDRAVLHGDAWAISCPLPEGAREALPVFFRHDWSGVVRIESGADHAQGDLFRLQWAIQPLRLKLSAPAASGQSLRVTPVGRNELSQAAQGVFCGYMWR